jgi:hypothetical protein
MGDQPVAKLILTKDNKNTDTIQTSMLQIGIKLMIPEFEQ